MNKLIRTYLGFSIKSKAIVIGQDRLKVNKGKIYLIVYCSTASQNLKDLSLRLATKFKCKAIMLPDMESYTNISGCKVLGLTNESLANAIIKVAENNQETGEVNGK